MKWSLHETVPLWDGDAFGKATNFYGAISVEYYKIRIA